MAYFIPTLYAYTRTCAHAHEAGAGEMSAKSADDAQSQQQQGVSAADLPADFGQTSPPPPVKSAGAVARPRRVDWYTAYGEQLPKVVLELSAKRDGWTPQGWHDRLLQMAGRCEEDHPERAAELRRAARLMEGGAEGGP